MKYVLYKFPYEIRPMGDGETPCLPDDTLFPVKLELIAVEFGSSIFEVTNDLIRDVVNDLSETEEYKGCKFTADVPKEPNIIKFITDQIFHYEMLGIIASPYSKENMLIIFGIKVAKE